MTEAIPATVELHEGAGGDGHAAWVHWPAECDPPEQHTYVGPDRRTAAEARRDALNFAWRANLDIVRAPR